MGSQPAYDAYADAGFRLAPIQFPLRVAPMRVLIVDDVPAVREALRLLLNDEPGVSVVGETGDGDEALRLAAALLPDVVVIDLDLPHKSGLVVTRALAGWPNPPRVVAMNVFGADAAARRLALAAGAITYVEKGASLEEVVTALRAALADAGHSPTHDPGA